MCTASTHITSEFGIPTCAFNRKICKHGCDGGKRTGSWRKWWRKRIKWRRKPRRQWHLQNANPQKKATASQLLADEEAHLVVDNRHQGDLVSELFSDTPYKWWQIVRIVVALGMKYSTFLYDIFPVHEHTRCVRSILFASSPVPDRYWRVILIQTYWPIKLEVVGMKIKCVNTMHNEM